jgi:transposase-like protein
MPRGVAHGPENRSFLIGLHVQGRSLSDLSREFGIPREVLSRWWQRMQAGGLDALTPRSRRPRRSHTIPRRAVRRILQLRRRRIGPARIAALVGDDQ